MQNIVVTFVISWFIATVCNVHSEKIAAQKRQFSKLFCGLLKQIKQQPEDC